MSDDDFIPITAAGYGNPVHRDPGMKPATRIFVVHGDEVHNNLIPGGTHYATRTGWIIGFRRGEPVYEDESKDA